MGNKRMNGRSLSSIRPNLHICLTPLPTLIPHKRHLNRRARIPRRLQQMQRNLHNLPLHSHIPWLTAGVPQREITKHKASHTTLLHNIPRRPDYHCRQPLRLQMSRRQTGRLMANRSQRQQKSHIHPIRSAHLQDSGRMFHPRQPLTKLRRHTIKAGR